VKATILKDDYGWAPNDIDRQLIDHALTEDLGVSYCDLTSNFLFPDHNHFVSAHVISKHPEPIKLCGLNIVPLLLDRFNNSCVMHSEWVDGDVVPSGNTLLTLTGPAPIILMLERTLLNFLQRLCAIATLTKKYVDKITDLPLKILDTRKTTPGFRHMEKYAVYCGGGVNHRMGLYDAVMVKDTHVDMVGGMDIALSRLPDLVSKNCFVIVEVRNKAELKVVLTKGREKVSRVLLDNMSLSQLSECTAMCKGIFATEASGNIHLENIRPIAEIGLDFASIGKLTHSAGNVDLSMICELKNDKE
jgi:nicotinate-nucleotide pyrophosphorylase (carboxylating)